MKEKEFLELVRQGKINDIKAHQEIKSDLINAKDEQGNTALHIAVKNNDLDLVKFLVDNGADLYAENNRGETPARIAKNEQPTFVGNLMNAISNETIYHDYSEIQEFLESKQYKEAIPDKATRTAFLNDVKSLYNDSTANSAEIRRRIEDAIKSYPTIADMARDDQGNSALHLAAINGNQALAERIVEAAPELLIAENAKRLIPSQAAKGNQSSPFGYYVGGYADTKPVQDYLEAQQIERNMPSRSDTESFLQAVKNGNIAVIRSNLEKYPDIANKAVDSEGNTALHLAVISDRLEAAKILVQEGYANIYAENNNREKPIDITTVDEIVFHTPVEIDIDKIINYLKEIDEKIKVLHAQDSSRKLKSGEEFLEKLKAENRKSLLELKEEERAKKEKLAAVELKRLKEREVSLEAEVAGLKEQKVTVNGTQYALGDMEGIITKAEEDARLLDGTQSELLTKKEELKQLEKELIPTEVNKKLGSRTLGKILEKKTSKKSPTDEKTKLELLSKVLGGGSTDKEDKELASLFAKERISAKMAKAVTLGWRKTDYEKALAIIKDAKGNKEDADKKLAALLAKKRYSARLAKKMTGRATDNDLAQEVIETIRTAYRNAEKDVNSTDREKLKEVTRWKPRKGREME